MYTQLEDEFGDVVGKARRGQEIAVAALADRVGLTAGDIARIEDYELVPGRRCHRSGWPKRSACIRGNCRRARRRRFSRAIRRVVRLPGRRWR